jgi:hypothetical protein
MTVPLNEECYCLTLPHRLEMLQCDIFMAEYNVRCLERHCEYKA